MCVQWEPNLKVKMEYFPLTHAFILSCKTFPLLLEGSWRKYFQVSAKMLLVTLQTFKQVT